MQMRAASKGYIHTQLWDRIGQCFELRLPVRLLAPDSAQRATIERMLLFAYPTLKNDEFRSLQERIESRASEYFENCIRGNNI